MIIWDSLYNLKYFILLPIFLFFIFYKVYKNFKLGDLLTGSTGLLKNYSKTKVVIKSILMIVGLVFLFFALLSPQWGKKDKEVDQKGRDILIGLDVSKSMLAQDDQPNRLEFAKKKIKDLLDSIDSERVGLILFSSTSFVQCPLTKDVDSFINFLDQVDVESISGGTTNISNAISTALDMFDQSVQKNKKLLVLFTDGEDFSKGLEDVSSRAKEENLSIVTVGLGSVKGAPIPLYDVEGKNIGYQKKKDGSVVISQLDESTLKKLSNETGGVYIKATKSDEDVDKIYAKINQMEKQSLGKQNLNRYINRYNYFVLVTFIALLLESLL